MLGVAMSDIEIPIPESYFYWRLSQGIEEGAIPILYSQRDSKNIDEMQVYVKTHHIENAYELDVKFAIDSLANANYQMCNSGNQDLTLCALKMNSTCQDILLVLELMNTGFYDAALTLIRSSIEGLLRMSIKSVKDLEPYFEKIISKKEWPTKISKDRLVSWDDPLKEEKKSTIFDMCVILDKLSLTHPIRGSYEYLEIKDLNLKTHKNVDSVRTSDSNIFNQTTRQYSRERHHLVTKYYLKYLELSLVLSQNAYDCISFRLAPLLMPSKELELTFPVYSNLLKDRLFFKL